MAYLTATREMTSLRKQNPQTSKVLKLVHAAVVAKNIKTGYLSFQLTKQIPSRKMGANGWEKERRKKRWDEVGGGYERKDVECSVDAVRK